ncbi:hypothetical protein [Staphylococcus pseudintermedius]|uniref:hypothetical protein n=1 Tax=Staphylococcus pseudintermedius TaxID=283734 RepID=UPI0028FD9F9B|nr:hypothetical protein [Staphylococcus pseudintermedius]MDU0383627.1 hypothetical protein [Staphylococcus pseudintermedius]
MNGIFLIIYWQLKIDLYIHHKGQIDVGSNIFLEIYRKYEIGNIYFENLVQEEYYKDYLEKVVKDAFNENMLDEVAVDEEIDISLVILLVEAYLNTDHITKVIDIFEKVCNKYPHNDLLKQNKDHLASIKRESK